MVVGVVGASWTTGVGAVRPAAGGWWYATSSPTKITASSAVERRILSRDETGRARVPRIWRRKIMTRPTPASARGSRAAAAGSPGGGGAHGPPRTAGPEGSG